jgi:hypothetical protein
VQRARQDDLQLVTILVRQPSEQLEALRRRRLTDELYDLFCASPTPVGKPSRSLEPLIERRHLAPRTPRQVNHLAVHDPEMELDQIPPIPRAATTLEGDLVAERETLAEWVARFAGFPRWAQVLEAAVGVSAGIHTVVVAHAEDSATTTGLVATIVP